MRMSMSGTSGSPQVARHGGPAGPVHWETGLAEQTGLTSGSWPRVCLCHSSPSTGGGERRSLLSHPAAGRWPCQCGCSYLGRELSPHGRGRYPLYADGKVKVELGDDPGENRRLPVLLLHPQPDGPGAPPMSCLPTFFTQAVFTENRNRLSGHPDCCSGRCCGIQHREDRYGSCWRRDKHQVTVVLTDEQKAKLQADYPAGAYVEGFVYAKGEVTEEGMQGTEHSIPVLGFYGNWTDPSMYDVGSRA